MMHLRTTRVAAWIVGILIVGAGIDARGAVIFDGFTESGVSLSSASGSPAGGNYSIPSLPGGRRTIAYINSLGSGTLTLDTSSQTLALATTDQGTVFLGYGYSTSNGSGVQNSWPARMNADWTGYSAIRIPILSNTRSMNVIVHAGTQRLEGEDGGPKYDGSGNSGQIFVDNGWTGNLDIPLSSITGTVDWADVDRFLIVAQNVYFSSDFTLGPIQLVPVPEPASLVLLSVGIMAVQRRRPTPLRAAAHR